MLHDARNQILGVRINRTPDQARRLQAMIAAHREMKALRVGIEAAFNLSNPPPIDVSRVSVLLITGDDAALAADTLRHIEVEAILFAGLKRSTRDQRL